MFVVDNKRITTMRKHLGKASELIKDDAYLPMFRNRQKKYKQEFDESVEVARTKRDPERYLASYASRPSMCICCQLIILNFVPNLTHIAVQIM